MINQSLEHRGVLDAIAHWVKRYREAIGLRNEMANCTPEQVAVIARDMGLSPWGIVIDNRQRTTRCRRTAKATPCTRRRSAEACIRKSWHDARLAANLRHLRPQGSVPARSRRGTAASHYRDYCPNAISLGTLFQENRNEDRRI